MSPEMLSFFFTSLYFFLKKTDFPKIHFPLSSFSTVIYFFPLASLNSMMTDLRVMTINFIYKFIIQNISLENFHVIFFFFGKNIFFGSTRPVGPMKQRLLDDRFLRAIIYYWNYQK